MFEDIGHRLHLRKGSWIPVDEHMLTFVQDGIEIRLEERIRYRVINEFSRFHTRCQIVSDRVIGRGYRPENIS